MDTEEMLNHMDDCRGAALRDALSGAPGVDFLDQFWLDPDAIFAVFGSHAAISCRVDVAERGGAALPEVSSADFSLFAATWRTTS
jgi:hypothetical protein